jgi:hypothetical protein
MSVGSLVYEALCTGRKVGGGGVPRAPSRPVVDPLSRSSIMVNVRYSISYNNFEC